VKLSAKRKLSDHIGKTLGIVVDPASLFDIQAKRIHEYKRQHLNLLHIISLYCRLKNSPNLEITPRTFIFGGKAAPGYHMAKLIIKLIHAVADVVNRDPQVNRTLKVVFVPDFNVQNAQTSTPPPTSRSLETSVGGRFIAEKHVDAGEWPISQFTHRVMR
jgi:glycogen phosphorylase